MKVSKIFGFVLFFHVGVIGLLIVQPGCRTTQPPTETYQQNRTIGVKTTKLPSDLIPAKRVDGSLDPAFNSGFEGEDGRFAPSRPGSLSDFGDIAPLDPIAPGPTVDIAGPSYETYTVKRGDSLWKISKDYNIPVSELYAANGLNKNSVIKVGQQIQIPVEGSTASVSLVNPDVYQPSGYNTAGQEYIVKSGDNLTKIARQFGTTVSEIKAINGKSSDVIRIGEKLIIPAQGGATPTPVPAPTSSSTPVSSTATDFHIVQAGEYPGTIAPQYGMTATELLVINDITDPRTLQIGQRLKVNKFGSSENIATKTETVPVTTPRPTTSFTPSSTPVASTGPVEIRVVEADPLIESETEELDTDALFESAVEIPVIRLEE
ncbi:MAG: LysM peptidoglycan-binding domain-containing protein [Verrucomicrobiota bacterium]